MLMMLGQKKKCPEAQKEECAQKRRKQDTWAVLSLDCMGTEFHTQSSQWTHKRMGRNGSEGGWSKEWPCSLSPGTCHPAIVLTFDLASTCLGQCPLGSILAGLRLARVRCVCPWHRPLLQEGWAAHGKSHPDLSKSWSPPEVAACHRAAQPSTA